MCVMQGGGNGMGQSEQQAPYSGCLLAALPDRFFMQSTFYAEHYRIVR